MKKINILTTVAGMESDAVKAECLKKIAGVSSRVNLIDVSEFLLREQRGDLNLKRDFDALLQEAEVMFVWQLPEDILKRAPCLKWVQVTGAGVDMLLTADIINSPLILTNVSGMHAVPIGEYILYLILALAKKMPYCNRLKQEKNWQRYDPMLLHGKTLGIIGLGHIGRETARLAKSLGMKVIATRRSVTGKTHARNVDIVIPRQRLAELLAASDFIVITLPLTPETNKLIGEKELRIMKTTAYLVNIGRGPIIDEDALICALEEHRIAGAGLDVFTREPLPKESKLWDFPDVIISPHVSGAMVDYHLQATDIFCDNLKRYLNGKKLHHIVNKKLGY